LHPILLIPGYQGSGPGHWQSLWEAELPGAIRVIMPSWEHPVRADWIGALDEAIVACDKPPILVGHSLGAITIVLWASAQSPKVHGALLATPADVERPDALEVLRPFGPIPRCTLPFPSVLAASSEDPFMATARAREFARE
jgi:predicted alpha/beta hydrolase family esterase